MEGKTVTENYKECPQCGFKYHSRANICPKCHQDQSDPEKKMQCPLCKTAPMKATEIPLIKDQIVRFCGIVIAFLAVVSLALGIYEISNGSSYSGGILLAGGIVEGALGFLLISARQVWACPRCGHYLNRYSS
jgi:DNA-directed RNA polymerase subunit RPC12/RpoP